MNNDKCIICGNHERSVIYEYSSPDQYEIAADISPNDYYRAWVNCTGCGLHYSIFSRGKYGLDKIYQTTYRSKDAPWRNGATVEQMFDKITKLPPGESETKRKVSWIKTNIKNAVEAGFVETKDSPSRFLDVGGGNGVFAYEFKDETWQPFVVDPSEEGQFMRSHGINYTEAYFETGLFDIQFDLITLNCVLEHLHEPVDILKIAKNNLSADGFLYVEVPDAIHFNLVAKEDDIFNSCHLWMFDPSTISRLLFEAGFQIYALERVRLRKGIGLWVLAGHQKQLSTGVSADRNSKDTLCAE